MAVIPDSNVNLATNVRDVLNGAGGSVGNSLTSFFSTAAKINKWAKYKPTIYYNQPFLDDDRRWKGENGLCGFTSSSIVFNDTSALVSAFRNNATFVYDIPSGGTSEPMRLGDFRLYKTDAKSPIWSFDYTGQMATNNPSSSSTFTLLGNGDIDENYNLKMSDLAISSTSLSSYYFGVVFADTSGNVVLTSKSSSVIGTSKSFNPSVTVTASQFNAGKYMAYPCFIDATERTFVACPIGAISFEVVVSVDANMLGWMSGTGYWSMTNRFNYKGQLAYSSSYEGTTVYIALQVNGVDVSGENVTLVADSQSSDGKRKYMTYTRSIIRSIGANEEYRLRVGYGTNMANDAYLNLVEGVV